MGLTTFDFLNFQGLSSPPALIVQGQIFDTRGVLLCRELRPSQVIVRGPQNGSLLRLPEAQRVSRLTPSPSSIVAPGPTDGSKRK
jgi:hypothetical protein